MMSERICLFITTTVLCLLLLATGCGRSAKQIEACDEKIVETKVEPEKVVETKIEPEKVVETKVEPEKMVETKVEPKKVVETKVEPEKTVETKVEPEKTIETKVEPDKPVTKVEPDKPGETKVEPDEQKSTVTLTLKFEPNDISTYKVVMEAQKSVLWEGPAPTKPSAFKGGLTSSRSEITFTQQIKSVDEQGNAIAVITIKNLKYLAKARDNVAIDFDSSREKDKSDPMNGLIGRGYSIKITPTGKVVTVTGTADAQAAVKGNSATAKAARSLLGGEVIKQRHSIPALPAKKKSRVSKGDNWSALRSFDFGMLGAKSYERVYKLDAVEDSDRGKIAVAQMSGVPSSEDAAELHKQQSSGFLSKLFDNTEEYTGRLKLNLSTGKVEKYREELKSEWLAVDPESAQKPNEQPAALRMTAVRFYEIERID